MRRDSIFKGLIHVLALIRIIFTSIIFTIFNIEIYSINHENEIEMEYITGIFCYNKHQVVN